MSDGTTVTDIVDDAVGAAGAVGAAPYTADLQDAVTVAAASKRTMKKRKRSTTGQSSHSKKSDLGDGVNTWRVAVQVRTSSLGFAVCCLPCLIGVCTCLLEQDGSGDDGAPRLTTVAIGWETDPAKDPTEYVGKPIREFWYRTTAKEDETPAQVCAMDFVTI